MIPAEENDRFIETRGLDCAYRVGPATVRALAGVDLQVRRGEFLGGAGRERVRGSRRCCTCWAAWTRPPRARFGSAAANSRRRRHTNAPSTGGPPWASSSSSYYLVPSLTAEGNVALALTFQGTFGLQRTRLAAEAIRRVGLEHRAGHRPSQLSGGEQQRVAIARAIVHRPPLLLADEPTGNLDRATAVEVVSLLDQVHRELGTTVVMVTHDEELVSPVADRMIHLRDGRLTGRPGAAP